MRSEVSNYEVFRELYDDFKVPCKNLGRFIGEYSMALLAGFAMPTASRVVGNSQSDLSKHIAICSSLFIYGFCWIVNNR